MLIDQKTVIDLLLSRGISIKGALHIGAHECEELNFYLQLGITKFDIIWIDGIPVKVKEATDRGIPNVFHALITNKDNEEIALNVSNNFQSSSVLAFGSHATEHPSVKYVDKIIQKSITVDSFFLTNGLDPTKFNFWNFDIQGAELMALQGATQSLKYADAIYLEVNEK